MKFKYFNSVVCFCLTLAVFVSTAQALDKEKNIQGLSHYIAGGYYEGIGDLDKAVREYQQALEADPQSSLLHLNLASVLIRKNELDPAIVALKRSAALDPLAVEPHAVLALVYAAQNKADLLVQEYALALKNAAKLEPKNIEIYKSLGAIYLEQGKLKEAEGIFNLIVGLAPLDAEAHFYLASIYYDLKDFVFAEKELKSAVKLNPDLHPALNFLGYFYLEQNKNIDQAGGLIRRALSFEPENGAYIDSLGWFYFKKGKFKEALSQLEKAASFLSNPEIYDHLGEVFLKLGDPENAKLNWEKSLKLDSSQEKVKEKLLKVTNNGK